MVVKLVMFQENLLVQSSKVKQGLPDPWWWDRQVVANCWKLPTYTV